MSKDPEVVPGTCACGAVRLEAGLPPRFVAHCHCANCRRMHGAGFVTWVGFPAERFRFTRGTDVLHRWRAPNGSTWTGCGRCGSRLTFEGRRWPDEVHVAAGALDGPVGALPSAHAHADDAPDWCPVSDDLPRLGGPSGSEPLPPAGGGAAATASA